MTETTLTFYWGSGSPWAWRAMLGLELKGLKYQSKLLQFSKGEHKSPELLALNPRGKVPVLVHGDTVVYESLAILAYLDRAFPQPPLFGTDAKEAALVWRLVAEHDAYVAPLGTRVVRPLFLGDAKTVEEGKDDIRAAADELHKEIGAIEERLAAGEWLVGKHPSAADAAYFVSLQQVLRAAGKPAAESFGLGFTPLEKRYPRIAKWAERFGALPGVERTWPPHWSQKQGCGALGGRSEGLSPRETVGGGPSMACNSGLVAVAAQRPCRMPRRSRPQPLALSITLTTNWCSVAASARMLTPVESSELAALHRRRSSSASSTTTPSTSMRPSDVTVTTTAFGSCFTSALFALGSLTRNDGLFSKVVVRMKKMRSWNTTSMSGVRSMSTPPLLRLRARRPLARSVMLMPPAPAARAPARAAA